MSKEIVLYTAIYPYKNGKYKLTDVIYRFTNNIAEVYKKLKDLEDTYPEFYDWYTETVTPELKEDTDRRNIIFAISDVLMGDEIVKKLTGLAIIKNSEDEKKICTFRIFSQYKKQGVGLTLLHYCFQELGTTKPLISISKPALQEFGKYIEIYDWQLKQILPNYYKDGITEYVYNGYLVENLQMDEKKRMKIQEKVKKYF